jgi:hypothetical protein
MKMLDGRHGPARNIKIEVEKDMPYEESCSLRITRSITRKTKTEQSCSRSKHGTRVTA